MIGVQRKRDIKLTVPAVFRPLFTGARRRNYIYGGRGSAKSHSVAQYCVYRAYTSKVKVLCTRELQKSISESVHALLCDKIRDMGLEDFFTIYKDRIIGANGSVFIFAGVRQNVGEIKSMEGVDICWVEEAQSMSRQSLDVLCPTIRAEGSVILFTFNPFKDTDPVYVDATSENPDWLVIKANYSDNPYFPEVLRAEMEFDRRNDYDKYLWVWEGQCLGISEAQIFRGKFEVREFDTPRNAEFHFGCDWGFATDPSTLIRSFVVGNTLYIDQAVGKVGCDLEDTPALFDQVEGSRIYPIYADSARPETISFMNAHGFRVLPSEKWNGSIEDGIQYLRSFSKIVIHPRCRGVAEEFELYQYKVDRQTNEVLREPVDKFNHFIDALRYSHVVTMRAGNNGKVYAEFDMDCVEKPRAVVGDVFLGSMTLPGRIIWVAAELSGGVLSIVDGFTQNVVDFAKAREMFPNVRSLTWMPMETVKDIQQNFVEACVDAGIEPAVPGVLPADNEATKLVNDLFAVRQLKVLEGAFTVISCLNERVFLSGGKQETSSREQENARICRVLEYLVWRVVGRMSAYGEEDYE